MNNLPTIFEQLELEDSSDSSSTSSDSCSVSSNVSSNPFSSDLGYDCWADSDDLPEEVDNNLENPAIIMTYPPPPNYKKFSIKNPILAENFVYPNRQPPSINHAPQIPSLLSLRIERPAAVTDEMLWWYLKNGYNGCWRCMSRDHFIKDCDNLYYKEPVCFNCGLRSFTVVNCPVCSEEYHKKGPYTKRYLSTRQKNEQQENSE